MTRHCKRPKGAEVSTIFQCEQAERYNHKQYGFLVDMPAEQEGSVATQSKRRDECIPVWLEPEFDERGLGVVSAVD